MKIAILVTGLPPEAVGGTEAQAQGAAQRLAARHQVLVLTRSGEVAPALSAQPGCSVVQRCRTRVRGLRFAADLLATLVELHARRGEIEVIVAYQTLIDGLIAVLARRLWKIPALVWIRSTEEFRQRASLRHRVLGPWVFRHADRVVVQSATLRERFLAELRRGGRAALAAAVEPRLRVIGNGVTLREVRPDDRRGIVFVGRLVALKGVDRLIEAMRACPRAELTIVGDGPERRRLEAAARDLPNVRFLGAVSPDRVPDLIAAAGILVLPSLRDEGLPNVVLEAMASGTVVVASRIGGIPDLVRDRETGILIEPGDVDDLAAAIEELVSDPALRAALRARARAAVASRDWESVVAALETELRALRAGRAMAGPATDRGG